MSVGTPPDRYDRNWFSRAFDRLVIDVRSRYSRSQDVVIDGNRLVLTSPTQKKQFIVRVDDLGNLTTEER